MDPLPPARPAPADRVPPGFELVLAYLDALGAALGDLVIYQLDPIFDCLGSCPLEVGVQRRVDAVGLFVQLAFVELAGQSIADQIDKIRRVTGFHVGRRQLQRRGFGFVGFAPGDGVGFHHTLQNQVAAFQSPLGVTIGR